MTLLHARPVSFDSTWANVESAVFSIDLSRGRGLSQSEWMRMYTDVYMLAVGKPDAVYFRLKHALQQHVQSILRALRVGGDDLIDEYLHRWKDYATIWESLQHLFAYLDRYWIRQNSDEIAPKPDSGICPVHSLAMSTWSESLFSRVKDHLFASSMALVSRDRRGGSVNFSPLKALVQSYVDLGVSTHCSLRIYQEHFESGFLAETKAWYLEESQRMLGTCSISAYISQVEEWLDKEERRAHLFLDKSSLVEIKRACEQALIIPYKDAIYGEADRYLRENSISDLQKMFRLLRRTEKGLGPLQDCVRKFIEASGKTAIQSLDDYAVKDPLRFIECIWEVYQSASTLVKSAFSNDALFLAALDQACRKWININAKSAEMLAKYCHVVLDRGFCDDTSLDMMVRYVSVLFRYVERKDTFERFYAQYLARRLAHASSASEEAEESVLKTLTHICGFEYTQKLNRMLLDKSLSREVTSRFQAWHSRLPGKHQGHHPDFGILVLTAGAWPLEAHPGHCFIPAELAGFVTHFSDWYCSQHSGRKLTWLHHISRADVLTLFTSTRYELQISLHQLAILFCFNKGGWDPVSFADIRLETGLDEADTKRALQGLLRFKLLISENEQDDKEIPSSMMLNSAFTSKRPKVRMSGSAVHTESQENESIHKAVEEDRRMGIQAAIVRIMKARKELSHVELVNETISLMASRFHARASDVKANIDCLIEKEYLVRVEDNMNRYQYVA